MILKRSSMVVLAGALVLAGCTEPSGEKTRSGAIIGGIVGAAAGAMSGGSNSESRGNAVKGAIIGAGLGAVIGNTLDKQEADLRRDMGNDNVVITNTGDRLIVTLPQDILFATDSSTVRSDLRSDLGSLADNLQSYPNSNVQVIGHTDNVGEAAYNQQLSERRANAVANILVDEGVPSRRVTTYGRGESQPVTSNLNSEGRAQNRRVEIVILPTS